MTLYYDTVNKWGANEELPYTPTTLSKITWNNYGASIFENKNGLLLTFSTNLSKLRYEFDGGANKTNLVGTRIGEKIKLDGVMLKDIEGAEINYYALGHLWIYVPGMIEYTKLEIESTNFLNVTLPSLTLYSNGSKWEFDIPPQSPTVHSLGIANDENNNILETVQQENPEPRYRTLLKYDNNLGENPNTINVLKTVGDGILLNGVPLSEINNALIDYANGTKYIRIKIPQAYQDSLTGDVILEVISGTPFENQILDGSKYILRNGQWVVFKKAEPVFFKSILWNNHGSDIYEGKNGVLLSYSANLSNVPNEVKGSLKNVNYKDSLLGERILIDGIPLKNIDGALIYYFGSSFLFIYVPNMDTYKSLDIESTEFLVSILPESHFALFDSLWYESFRITHIINGESFTTYEKKNSGVTLSNEYYSALLNKDTELLLFKVDDNIYSMGMTLKVNSDINVYAITASFNTLDGAQVKISSPSSLRFQSRIDKSSFDYLVERFGRENIEVGTFICKNELLGLTPFNIYFKNNNNEFIKDVVEHFVNESTVEEDGYYKYYGSVNNIQSTHYTTQYFGIGYIKVTDEDNEYYIFGDNEKENHIRSIYSVDTYAYKDYSAGSTDSNTLKEHLDSVLSLNTYNNKIEISNDINNYVAPFTFTFDDNKMEYIIEGDNISSILINGIKKDDTTIITLNDKEYKIEDFSFSDSKVSFKLNEINSSASLVDFLVNIKSNQEFRILQLTDTQIIDSSQMRSPDRLSDAAIRNYSRSNIDAYCFNGITELIDRERPDLIIFTGDIVYGEFDDSGEILKLIIDFLDSFNIPWAPVFGNHDNESKMGVDWQCAQLTNSKNCLFKKGSLSGNGNYSIGLVDENGKLRRVIYMLDSGGCLTSPGLKTDQIEWFKNNQLNIENEYGEKVPAFLAFHIPSLDFKDAYINKYMLDDSENFDLSIIGMDDDFGKKQENNSIFPVSLKNTLKEINIDGVFVGHDHVTNYSINYDGVRFTYGLKTGIYDYHGNDMVGGTLIKVLSDGAFNIEHKYIDVQDSMKKESNSLTITFMSDLHIDTSDYGGFYCTKSKDKFREIIKETPSSRFYINLGDTVNSMYGSYYTYYDAISVMKECGLNVYNNDSIGYIPENKMIYNLLGNHEVAYQTKDAFKEYTSYIDGVGNALVFKYEDLLFVQVDALSTRSGSESPDDLITTTEFMIQDKVINYLKQEVESQMDSSIKGIVWISHIAYQDIDEVSRELLLNELKSYNLPISIFEGHTHIESYKELKDNSGNIYAKVYTLPAVTLYDNYPYYNVTFKDGEVLYIDKR